MQSGCLETVIIRTLRTLDVGGNKLHLVSAWGEFELNLYSRAIGVFLVAIGFALPGFGYFVLLTLNDWHASTSNAPDQGVMLVSFLAFLLLIILGILSTGIGGLLLFLGRKKGSSAELVGKNTSDG